MAIAPVAPATPIAPPASAATLRKVCAKHRMPRAAHSTKAQCLDFLSQLAQRPENPALSPLATVGT